MDVEYSKIKDTLNKYNQNHLLNFYEKLDEEKKQKLIKQITKIDFEQISNLYENTKKKIEFNDAKIEPINYFDKSKMSKEEISEYEKIGSEIIRKEKYAVVTMAGGQGTRLGHKGPKGTFDIGLDSH